MVNMNDLEAGDTVTWRNGKEFTVKRVRDDGSSIWPFGVDFVEGMFGTYNDDGTYDEKSKQNPKDIVAITKKEKKKVADLSILKDGHIVILRNGSAVPVASVKKKEGERYTYRITWPNGSAWDYDVEGIAARGITDINIELVIPDTSGRPLEELIEEGIERLTPKKFLFKGESESRELKVGDRLIGCSGYLRKVKDVDRKGIRIETESGDSVTIPLSMSRDYALVYEGDALAKNGNKHGIIKVRNADEVVVLTGGGYEVWDLDDVTI